MRVGIDLDYTLIYRGDEKGIYETPGSIEFLMKNKKHEFIVISARGSKDIKIISVICSYIEKKAGIVFSNIVLTDGMIKKGLIAKKYGCTFMIDDKQHNLDDCEENGVIPIVFNGDWNIINDTLNVK